MAGQSIFCRAVAVLNGSKMILTNRINHVNFAPTCKGLKHDTSDEKFRIPEKPKRPLTAFFTFMVEKRPILRKENPDLQPKDIVKKISEEWKILSAVAKEKYEEQAKQSKLLYERKILDYQENLTPEQENLLQEISKEKDEDRKRRRYKKALREEHKPKRPATTFGMFLRASAEKGNRGQKSLSEFMKEVKDQWSKMTDAEKNKYKMEYDKNKEQYDKELAAWEAKMLAKGNEQLVRTKTLNEFLLKKQKGGKGSKSE